MLRPLWLLLALTPALAAEPALTTDFARPLPPGFSLIGDANMQDGVLRTRSIPSWQRSGLEIAALPLAQATWTIGYDFRPISFSHQGQEFTSQSPATHWYMAYVHPGGGINLHTRQGAEWKLRTQSPQHLIEVGKWYHVQVTLTAISIRYVLSARDAPQPLWDSGAVALEDMNKETTALLTDEAPDDKAQTEWDNVTVATDNAAARQRLMQTALAAEEQRRQREAKLAMSRQLRAQNISLIPTPQQMKLGAGTVPVSDLKLTADTGTKASVATVQMILAERLGLACRSGLPLKLVAWSARQKAPWPNPQGYRLSVMKSGVQITAQTTDGFRYAAQTLCQLVGNNSVPLCEITDWPDIPARLCMIAIDQGGFQVVDVEYWKRVIRELAAVKINAVMPYFEGAGFYYEKYPFLALKGRNGFTIEKSKALSEYAWQHGIRLIPQQQTLGHSGSVLSHPELKHLAESGDVYCSSNPQTFAFLDDLFSELVQAFPHADYIHVGGDEFSHGFAKCDKCKARAEEIGKPGLYAEHMMKVRQLLASRKRGMMIWWNEAGYTEEAADRLAKDIVVFDWHYGNQSSYPSLQRMQDKGFAQTWATPAVTRYYDGGDDWDNTFGNISGFMAAGKQREVPGACTCTWVQGIWGGRNIFELNLYGLAFSGQCAWNSLANDYGDFRWRFARQWFGVKTRDADTLDALMLAAMHTPYGTTKTQGFWRNNRILEEMLAETLSKTAERLTQHPEWAEEAARLRALCTEAIKAIASLRECATRNQVTLDFMAHDVHIHDAAARRLQLVADLLQQWPQLSALPATARQAKLQPTIDGLKGLTADYLQIEKMFERSILEAGGGPCGSGGWVPFIAGGGIIFRAPQGRAEIEKTLMELEKRVKADRLPEKPL